MQLYDLIEFQFDHVRKCFVKKQTHKTNLPKAICYSEKKKLVKTASLHTRFSVVKNGAKQYDLTFKKLRKRVCLSTSLE
jgi:hypothetical protein